MSSHDTLDAAVASMKRNYPWIAKKCATDALNYLAESPNHAVIFVEPENGIATKSFMFDRTLLTAIVPDLSDVVDDYIAKCTEKGVEKLLDADLKDDAKARRAVSSLIVGFNMFDKLAEFDSGALSIPGMPMPYEENTKLAGMDTNLYDIPVFQFLVAVRWYEQAKNNPDSSLNVSADQDIASNNILIIFKSKVQKNHQRHVPTFCLGRYTKPE